MTEYQKIIPPKFPLYDNLSIKLNEKFKQGNFLINSEYRKNLYQTLNSCDLEQSIQIALLLIHHYFVTENVSECENPFNLENRQLLPYGIKISPSGKGFSFELNSLDISAQALLGTYCNI